MRFNPRYDSSYALVVGINNYLLAGHLSHAENDAQAVADHVTESLQFPADNVTLLLGSDATRERVLSEYYRFRETTEPDDRLLVFYAGHGHTVQGHRREVGLLIPHDGNSGDLSTLIRWDELTDGADLIPAKHILFIMDACYGGLAITRAAPPGSTRFLKDMLARRSRQVLTAGKHDEVVADGDGPRPGHSVFTGHLLDGLEGGAAANDGVLTANTLMAFVYDRVGMDPHSRQTPHFGHVVGDGDFIFKAAVLDDLKEDDTKEQDVLLHVPATSPGTSGTIDALTAELKECLSENRLRIHLHDLLADEVRSFHHATRAERFPVHEPRDEAGILSDFTRRLDEYEEASGRLQVAFAMIARWGKDEHLKILRAMMPRVADPIDTSGGITIWLGLRWYPAMLMIYTSGIAALAGGNFDAMAEVFSVRRESDHGEDGMLLQCAVHGLLDADRADLFKRLPGHERQYVPRSEYLLKRLQPKLDNLLFLGSDYERLFDRFEVLLALTCVDLDRHGDQLGWGPPGRFAWKERSSRRGPLKKLMDEAVLAGESWGPLQAGLFRGSLSCFNEVSQDYMERVSRLGWH